MVYSLQRFENSMGRWSLEPFGEVVYQVATVIDILKAELDDDLIQE